MPLARPKASSLSIPIPKASLWRLRRPPTPRRATYPLCLDKDTPPVSVLSFWDLETPSPPSAVLSSMSPTDLQLEKNIDTFKKHDSAMSQTSATSSWYSQSEETTILSQRAIMPISPLRPRLLLPPKSLCSDVPLFPPTSPHSARFPISPGAANSPRSPQSPYNPFLSPPVPQLTTKLFRLASPLLPASPLSIFDRAISPTSPTFLQSRTPSPGTPNQRHTFLRTATPSIVDCGTRDGMTPTWLWPRTTPAIPHDNLILSDYHEEVEADHALEQYRSPPTMLPPSPPTNYDQVDITEGADVRRKEMKIEFYHLLATKRASALNRLSAPPSSKSEKVRCAQRWWKLLPGRKSREVDGGWSRRRSFKTWSDFGS